MHFQLVHVEAPEKLDLFSFITIIPNAFLWIGTILVEDNLPRGPLLRLLWIVWAFRTWGVWMWIREINIVDVLTRVENVTLGGHYWAILWSGVRTFGGLVRVWARAVWGPLGPGGCHVRYLFFSSWASNRCLWNLFGVWTWLRRKTFKVIDLFILLCGLSHLRTS